MRLGVHMRTAGGLDLTARRAGEIGCEAMQVFASNPNAWNSPRIQPEIAERFRANILEFGIQPVVIHTPYLLNLATPDPDIRAKSIKALIESMTRAQMLGVQFVVTHTGSHKGSGEESGIALICEAVREVLDAGDWTGTMLLLENSAGTGNSVGSTFEQLRAILDCLPNLENRLGICVDTAHAWGAGYDLSSPKAVETTLADFDQIVGFRHIRLMHMNDTNVELGAHLGTGKIGEPGFTALLHHPALQSLAAIIETPAREDGLHDLDILKSWRESTVAQE